MLWNKCRSIGATIAQLLVGLTFVFSGIVKGIDPAGTAIKIEEYFGLTGWHLPSLISISSSVALNVVEVSLGIALLTGWRPKVTRWVALALMCGMTLLTLYIYIYEPVDDCGCFGDALVISNSATFWKNVGLLLLIIYLFVYSAHWHHWLPSRGGDWAISFGLLLLMLFNVNNISNEPIVDFRPYTIGSDLMELTHTGGTEGEYAYKFIYTKAGVERTFSIDELVEVDSTWTFVRDEVEVIKEAQRPLGADFVLVREDGSNAVESLSYKDGQAILIISPDLTEVSTNLLGKLIERASEPLLLAIGNSGEVWKDVKYSRYEQSFSEVLFLDKTTAKTVVRCNPGVLIIKGGKIVNKLSAREFTRRLSNSDFRANPYKMPSDAERALSYFKAFGGLAIFALVVLIWGVIYRIRLFNNKETKERL